MSSNDAGVAFVAPPSDPRTRFTNVFGDRPGAAGTSQHEPTDAEILAQLADTEALATQLMAVQSELLRTLRDRRLADQATERDHPPSACPHRCCDGDGWVTLEVAQTLAITERQAEQRLDTADRLQRHAQVAAAVAAGLLQAWTATKLLEHLDALRTYVSGDRLLLIERTTLAWLLAAPRTVTQLNARMRRLLLSVRPRDEETTARRGRERGVTVLPSVGADLATVVAHVPDADAAAIASTLRALAADPVCPGDTRTRDQRQADLFTSCLTGMRASAGFTVDLDLIARSPGAISVSLDVTIPADSIAGAGGPVTIPGYGEVPAQTGREIVNMHGAAVQARPLVYDATSGRLLGAGTPTGRMSWLETVAPSAAYAHPPVMERLVRLRDATCRAPACRRRADSCDCDHVVAYPKGPTSVDNTCSLCRRHHRLKTHAPGWDLAMSDDGTATWTSPSGRTIQTHPADYRPPLDRSVDDRPPF